MGLREKLFVGEQKASGRFVIEHDHDAVKLKAFYTLMSSEWAGLTHICSVCINLAVRRL